MEFLRDLFSRDDYTYDRLPHDRAIRLLQLVPARAKRHGFSVTLRTVSLDDAPPFCALSYTWNSATIPDDPSSGDDGVDDEKPSMVTVDCEGRPLSITETAFDFLCRALQDGLFIAAGTTTTTTTTSSSSSSSSSTVMDSRTARSALGEMVPEHCHLWIDAICINQTDLEERAGQVMLMAEIYQSCLKTIVWLGKEDPDAGARWVMQTFIPRFLELYRAAARPFFISRGPMCTDAALVRHFGEEVCARWRRDFRFFFLFLRSRRWFLRGWVVQEVLLRGLRDRDGVVVLCGSFTVSWAAVLGFLQALTVTDWRRTLLSQLRSDPATAKYGFEFSNILQRWHKIAFIAGEIQGVWRNGTSESLAWRYGTEMTDAQRADAVFFETVNSMRGRQFRDARDAIYACVGMLSGAAGPGTLRSTLAPDYRLPVAQVYIRAAWAMLTRMARLEVLNTLDDRTRKGARPRDWQRQLPSWVPDFSVPGDPPTRFSSVQKAFSRAAGFDAVGNKPPSTSHFRLVDGRILALPGAMIAVVSDAGPLLGVKDLGALPFEWFAKALASNRGAADRGEAPYEALCRAVVANILPDSIPNPAYPAAFRKWWAKHLIQRVHALESARPSSSSSSSSSSEAISDLLQLAAGGEWLPSMAEVLMATADDGSGAGQDAHVAHLDAVRHRLWARRRAFLTHDGRFGMGPGGLRAGDQIWLLDGGRTPFILRDRVAGGGHRILGETYVHGVMYGELATRGVLSEMRTVRIY